MASGLCFHYFLLNTPHTFHIYKFYHLCIPELCNICFSSYVMNYMYIYNMSVCAWSMQKWAWPCVSVPQPSPPVALVIFLAIRKNKIVFDVNGYNCYKGKTKLWNRLIAIMNYNKKKTYICIYICICFNTKMLISYQCVTCGKLQARFFNGIWLWMENFQLETLSLRERLARK